MALTQRLDLRQTQALVMTPQLQQAIKLLQMSNLELTTFVEHELEQNPLLEREEGDPESRESGPVAEPTPPAPPTEAAPLGASEPRLGEDVEAWRDAAGPDGQGDLDLAGDPEAWSGTATGSGFEPRAFAEGWAPEATLRDHLLGQIGVEIADPIDRMIGVHLIDLLDAA